MNPSHLTKPTNTARHDSRHRGQALVEMSIILLLMLFLVMGMVDFGRIYQHRLILVNVSREAANLAARGTPLTNVVNAMVTSATPLNIDGNGMIIITAVSRNASGLRSVTTQVQRGNTGLNYASRIGNTNSSSGTIVLPSNNLPQPNQTLFSAEVYYHFQPATPLGNLLGRALPTVLYEASYF